VDHLRIPRKLMVINSIPSYLERSGCRGKMLEHAYRDGAEGLENSNDTSGVQNRKPEDRETQSRTPTYNLIYNIQPATLHHIKNLKKKKAGGITMS